MDAIHSVRKDILFTSEHMNELYGHREVPNNMSDNAQTNKISRKSY